MTPRGAFFLRRLAASTAAVALALAPLGFTPIAQGASPDPSESGSAGKVQHLVFLMQENHTFDNYFSAFPGVEEPCSPPCQPNYVPYVAPNTKPSPQPIETPTPTPTPTPASPAPGATKKPAVSATPVATPTATPAASPTATPTPRPAVPTAQQTATACYNRFHLNSHRTVDLNHSTEAALHAYDGGDMDGFAAAQAFYNLPENLATGYYDGSDLPGYYNLASSYVLAQRFFSSAWGSSAINHMYSVAARGGGTVPTTGYDFATIFDRLEAAGVSWKFYVQNYASDITFRTVGSTNSNTAKQSQLIWDPLANFARFIDDPKLASHIVDLQQYYTDLQNGTLPAVAYLVPSGLSEHPPGDISAGQSFGITTVTSLMRSSSWDSSVYIESWDDWGGWYDHVPPPQVDVDGYGFRVPALIVSPYARTGTIDNTTYDFTSILKFIEDNWKLQPLTARDATANSIAAALDLSKPPADPMFPAQTWAAQSQSQASNRSLLLAIYAAVVAVAVICGLFLLRPWQRQATRQA